MLWVVLALAGTSASAAIELLENVDIETESRFVPHGTPGVDHPNGYADYYHHGGDSAWSNGTTDPVTSGIHSLWLPDTDPIASPFTWAEMRSFATAIPDVGNAGRVLDLSWNWDWDITSGQLFTATVRISTAPVVGLDLAGAITDHLFFTDGSLNSGGFKNFLTSIPLNPADASFDIIFNTGDRSLANDTDPGKLDAAGVMFVDDISAIVPEPASLALMGLGGLAALRRRRA